MKNKNWQSLLTAEAELTLADIGQAVKVARQRRGLSIRMLSQKVGVDPRRISELEKGSPGVSLGIFVQVLSILGLTRGFAESLDPSNDPTTIGVTVRNLRKNKKTVKKISDDEVDF